MASRTSTTAAIPTDTSAIPNSLPQAFVWRRLHSLMGLWLVLFLTEHLLVNSQAALWMGDSGQGFVDMVNSIHNLPYLQVIEAVLLGVPILVHLIWGVKYLFTSKSNSYKSDGSKPSLPEYGRNRAYTWQRITSWILLFCLLGHVIKFRFIQYPDSVDQGAQKVYLAPLKVDDGLYTVAERLHVSLYDNKRIEHEQDKIDQRDTERALAEAADGMRIPPPPIWDIPPTIPFDSQKDLILTTVQKYQEKEAFVNALAKKKLTEGQVIAAADNFGAVSLLIVRETFKNPIYVVIYTIFVLAACFHAFNGFWTFLITWGVILKMSAQKAMVKFAIALMVLITFLGLIAIWGTYWLNLKM